MRTLDQLLTETTPTSVADVDYRRLVARGVRRRRLKRGAGAALAASTVAVAFFAYPTGGPSGVQVDPASRETRVVEADDREDPPAFVTGGEDLALFEQYQDRMYDYRDCMEDSGASLGWFRFDEQRGLYDLGHPADQQRTHDACSTGGFHQVDMAWQQRANVLSGYDAANLDRLRRCLDRHGLPHDADDSAGVLGVRLAEAGINRIADCPD